MSTPDRRVTVAHLGRLLTDRYGTSHRGGPDVDAAAVGLGVSPRTVRRWLAGSGRATSPIPSQRLRQLATGADQPPAPARGPTWTRARLLRVMRLHFGANRLGGVNTTAAAAAMGVSPTTVRRWLVGSSGRTLAHIPPRRLNELIALLLPSAKRLQVEADEARNARRDLTDLQNGDVSPVWEKQRWLEPHLVALLHLPRLGVYQLSVTRDEPGNRAVGEHMLATRPGRVAQKISVPTRIHGLVLVHHILRIVGPWRYQPHRRDVSRGTTWAWLDDAPRIDLDALHDEVAR